MISQDRLEKAIKYLAETDREYGRLRGVADGLEYRVKIAESQGFLESEGTQDKRKAEARVSTIYRSLVKELEETKINLYTIGTKRKTEELIIEVWRTYSANQRRGNI